MKLRRNSSWYYRESKNGKQPNEFLKVPPISNINSAVSHSPSRLQPKSAGTLHQGSPLHRAHSASLVPAGRCIPSIVLLALKPDRKIGWFLRRWEQVARKRCLAYWLLWTTHWMVTCEATSCRRDSRKRIFRGWVGGYM
jgi:hypothetical protein